MSNNYKTSAGAGWQQMKDLLDKDMPIHHSKNSNKRKYSLLLLLLLVGSCGVYKFINTSEEKNKIATVQYHEFPNSKQNTSSSKTEKNYLNTTNESDEIQIEDNNFTSITTNSNQSIKNHIKPTQINNESKSSLLNSQSQKILSSKKIKPKQTFDAYVETNADIEIKNVDVKSNNEAISNSNLINLNNTVTSKNNNTYLDQSNDIKSKDEKPNKTAEIVNSNKTNTNIVASANSNKVEKVKLKSTALSYGLDFVFPISPTNNLSKAYATNTLLDAVLPSFWVSKNLNNTSTLKLSLAANNQYIFNSNRYSSKSVSVASLSASNSISTQSNINQSTNLLKVVGYSLGAEYQKQVSKKINLGLGFQTVWVNKAVFQETTIKNATNVYNEHFFTLNKNELGDISSTYFSGLATFKYSVGKQNIGLRVMQPLSKIVNNTSGINSIPNLQLFYSFKFK